jgi:galactan endo-1,6-beta-galactosidase
LLSKINKINVHGYYNTEPYRGHNRALFRETVRGSYSGLIGIPQPRIWMSEYGDGDLTGMTMATSIILDLTELQPSAWVLWQVMDPVWGLFYASTDDSRVVGDPKPSYYALAQFSRHLTKGARDH